jgi:hypothetical protein
MTATKEAAAPPRSKTAAKDTQSQNSRHQKHNGKPSYIVHAEQAERDADQLIGALAEHGPAVLHGMPVQCFPSRELATIAARVIEATESGIRGWANIVPMFTKDELRVRFIACTEDGAFQACPAATRPLVDRLRAFQREKRKREIADQIRQRLDAGEQLDDLLAELRKIEAESVSVGIGDLLAERAFVFDNQPARPIPRFRLAGMPLCTAGNLTNIQAPPKAGKSAVVDAKLASVMAANRQGPDTLGFTAENPHGHALIHFDTEQSRYDADALVRRAIRRAGMSEAPPWFHSFSVADLEITERREALRHVLDKAAKKHGGVFAVLIDGIGDLCADPNDPGESFALVHELHALAIAHECTIVTVLHENPGSEGGKTRGHLGSQLERKAETNLRLAKDKEGVTTIWAERARHCYLPRESGPCFAWSDEKRMHISVGTAGEVKRAANRGRMESEADSAFGGESAVTYSDLVTAIMDALNVMDRAAKNRIKTWLAEGIIRKDSTGKYHLVNP